MRPFLAIAATFALTVSAAAETPVRPKPQRTPQSDTVLPLKGAAANSCAAYGAGFVRVEGTGSCVKLGGSIDVGVGVSSRR